jgi:nitrite reductase (NAD(P)H)
MDNLINTYEDEWAAVVRSEELLGVRIKDAHFYVVDPEKRSQFRQFVNTPEQRPQAEIITQRGQHRPADWPKSYPPTQLTLDQFKTGKEAWTWVTVAKKSDVILTDAGVTSVAVKYGDTQLAIFYVPRKGYYATQQMYDCQLLELEVY